MLEGRVVGADQALAQRFFQARGVFRLFDARLNCIWSQFGIRRRGG